MKLAAALARSSVGSATRVDARGRLVICNRARVAVRQAILVNAPRTFFEPIGAADLGNHSDWNPCDERCGHYSELNEATS